MGLSGGSEALKKELYFYRTNTGPYYEVRFANEKLSKNIENITSDLMRSEINTTGLSAWASTKVREIWGQRIPLVWKLLDIDPRDDGMGELNEEQYIMFRLNRKSLNFRSKAVSHAFKLQVTQTTIYIMGGIGTGLAAFGAHLWIAVTIAFVQVLTAIAEMEGWEQNIVKMNQAASDLANLRDWWKGLRIANKSKGKNRNRLICRSEEIIEIVTSGFLNGGNGDGDEEEDKQDQKKKKKKQQPEKEDTTAFLPPPPTTKPPFVKRNSIVPLPPQPKKSAVQPVNQITEKILEQAPEKTGATAAEQILQEQAEQSKGQPSEKPAATDAQQLLQEQAEQSKGQ